MDLSLLLLVSSLIFTVASRLLHLYSTVDKTFRFKDEKFLHSEGHPERFPELHGVEKREEGVRGDPNEMRWNPRGESKLASNHFLMCAPQSGPLRDIHGVIQRQEEGGRRQRWPGG